MLFVTVAWATPVRACTGDCDEDGNVTVDEILVGVNIALGQRFVGDCPPFDSSGDGGVTVDEIVRAVNNALAGCPVEPIFPADYRQTFAQVRDCRFSIEHGGVTIRVFANTTGASPYLREESPLPVGTVVVKEEFDAPDCGNDDDLLRWRVMRKEAPGFDPEDGDWHWQWVEPDRSVRFDDKATCISCHRDPDCLVRDYMCTEGGTKTRGDLDMVLEGLPAALLSVSGTSATDVYAVGADPDDGEGPLVLRYDGTRWRRLRTGAAGDVWWISTVPIDGAFYLVGAGGLVLRHVPGSEVFDRQATPDDTLLYGIWGGAADDLWAVGGDPGNPDEGGVIWHFDGDAWSSVDLSALSPGGIPTLFKVWGRAADDVYAVGARGRIVRYDGTRWANVASNSVRPLFTVHGNESLVVATGGFLDGVILERFGQEFVDQAPAGTVQMNGVFVTPDGSAVAVGREGAVSVRTEAGWSGAPGADTILDFHAAWVDSEGGIWAVGGDLTVDLANGILAYGGERAISGEIGGVAACSPRASARTSAGACGTGPDSGDAAVHEEAGN
jgi:hypothetical protein